jgi:hypothetical protein
MTRILVALFAFGALATLHSNAAPPAADKLPNTTCVKPCQDCAKI